MSDSRNPDDGLARDGIVHGVPRVAVSTDSTRVNKTGSWKYIRPEYRDRVAPCNQGCPVGVDIEGWMVLAKEGRLDEARALLLRENPMPAVTGRVCYHPCESACNRGQFDAPVAIHAVERMLGDLALDDPLPHPAPTRAERVAVVGSGPAGLACAYHLARLGYPVTVFESEGEPGGILRWGIPEYRLPKDVLEGEIDRIRALGVTIECGVCVGRDFPFEDLGEYDAVFVATGVHRSRRLGIPGEDLPGVRRGLEFLRDVNRGRRPDVGRRVVVVGGGNTAMDCARTAVRLGAEVTVLYRRGRAEMPANHEEVEQALHEGVRFGFLAAPVAVIPAGGAPSRDALDAIEEMFDGPQAGAAPQGIDGLSCVRMALGAPDASGRRRPEPVAGTGFFVPADTVLTALGEEADLDYLPGDVRPDDGVLRVNPLGGAGGGLLFAGGDVTDEPHTVAFALGSGKRAAIGIDWTLRMRAGEIADNVDLGELRWGGEGNLSVTRWRGDDPVQRVNAANQVVRFEDLNTAHFVAVARRPEKMRPAHERRHDFEEVNRGLGRDGVRAEVERCFNCGVCNSCEVCLIFCPDVAISRRGDGRFDIAYDYCKGCGLCAAECPRGAITMVGEGA